MLEKISDLDIKLLIYINKYSEDKYDLFWLFITNMTTWIPLLVVLLYLIYKNFDYGESLVVLMSILIVLSITLLFTELVKGITTRIRPNNNFIVSNRLRIIEEPIDYSFFSSHAANSFAVATLMISYLRHKVKWAYLFYLCPFIFSLSTLYIGIQYPSDLIVGGIVGCIIGYSAYNLTYSDISEDGFNFT